MKAGGGDKKSAQAKSGKELYNRFSWQKGQDALFVRSVPTSYFYNQVHFGVRKENPKNVTLSQSIFSLSVTSSPSY
ncbi:MAG: hypothetical protein J2P31_07075 [Blastocatellia bacterium]|nr:hypothetical protein [Blastocatellia bacterium]